MNKNFLYTSATPAFAASKLPKSIVIPQANWSGQTGKDTDPVIGDCFLMASAKDGSFDCIIPHSYILKDVKPSGAVLELDRSYMNAVPFEKARTIFNRGFSTGINLIAKKEFVNSVA